MRRAEDSISFVRLERCFQDFKSSFSQSFKSSLKKVVSSCTTHCELITIDKCGHYPSLEQPTILNNVLSKVCDNVFAI